MIEPDQILEGAARTLERAVLPALESGFARGQLHAVLEVLDALQGQLQWGGMLLGNEASMLSILISQAAEAVDGKFGEALRAHAGLDEPSPAERVRAGRALVCSLIEAGYADAGQPLAAAIDEYLANNTIFQAMALRPGRLAEISKG